MAEITTLVDDLDHSITEGVSNYKLINPENGRTYVVDLGPKNYDKLVKALAPFLEHARSSGQTAAPTTASTTTKKRPALTDHPSYNKVLYTEWAEANGIATGKRPKNTDVWAFLSSLRNADLSGEWEQFKP